ncbi:MAG: hypothetical protein ACFFDN_47200 [Candidatus Hodarchaeota archaeon]
MGKTLSLKLNESEIKKVNLVLKKRNTTPSKLLRNALWKFINEVNLEVNLKQQKKNNKKLKKVDQKVNLDLREKTLKKVNQVNHAVQIINNYELIRHYKEEIDWLRNRIEYFEGFCKELHEKSCSTLDTESKKKSLLSGVRM